jgi:methylase of polypeptide subunit release factors
VVEIGADQGPEVAELFSARLTDVQVRPDLAGRDRIVTGRVGELEEGARHDPAGDEA